MTQNSHRNSEYQLEDAPLTPIGSTLTQDVFKAVAILALAISAVTFVATRSDQPERLSRLSYPVTQLTASSTAVEPAAPAPIESLVQDVQVEDEPRVVLTIPTEAVTKASQTSSASAESIVESSESMIAEMPAPIEPSSVTLATQTAPAAVLPAWTLQRVGLGQVSAYRAPVIAPAIELPPLMQRDAYGDVRAPRVPRAFASE